MNRSKWLLPCLGLILAISTIARAQDGARLAPAEANVYIEINDLAQIRSQMENDAVVQLIQQNMPHKGDHKKWAQLQAMLNMTGPQILDNFFGQKVVIVGKETGDHQPAVVFTKVNAETIELAKTRLELAPDGELGGYELFTTKDGKARIGFRDGWIAASDVRFNEYFESVITRAEDAPSLANDNDFKSWVAKLPQTGQAMFFARNKRRGETHVVSMRSNPGEALSGWYAGTAPDHRKFLDKLGNAEATQFGPLPPNTIMATTFNIIDRNPGNTQVIDKLLAPKTFENDVLPKIEAPTVVFLGEVRGDQLPEKMNINLPVLGVAIKMKDAGVATELNQAMQGMLLIANMATTKWETAPITFQAAQHGGSSYNVADVGTPLSQRMNRPEIAGMRLTYGPIGSWYVITTQDVFFKQMVDAHQGKSLIDSDVVQSLPLKDVARPLGTFVLQAQQLQSHLSALLAHWSQVHPAAAQPGAGEPLTKEAKMFKSLSLIAELLRHYEGMSVQSYVDKDNTLHMDMHLQRKE